MVERKKRRTTQQVKDDIIKAVGNVISKQGFSKLGVVSVAEEAGMDKAMLYRHYKDFDDILNHYVEQEDFWIKYLAVPEHVHATQDNIVDLLSNIFTSQFKVLIENSKFQELLKWELLDSSELMRENAQTREVMAAQLVDEIQTHFPHDNIGSNNILAVITAGIYYLVMHKNVSTFAKVDLNKKDQQEKFISNILWLVKRIFSPITETERIALNCINKGLDTELIAEVTGLTAIQVDSLRNKK